MPSLKLTQLPAAASVVAADLMYVVTDVAGTPTSKKVLISALATGLYPDITDNPGVLVTIGVDTAIGVGEAVLDPLIQGYVSNTTMLLTAKDSGAAGATAVVGIEAQNALGPASGIYLALLGLKDNTTNGAVEVDFYLGDDGQTLYNYGFYNEVLAGVHATKVYGLYQAFAVGIGAGAVLDEYSSIWIADQAGSATQVYYEWFDSRGVYRIKEDSAVDGGNAQAVTALYNPRFTKYTPGAANYERVVQQWNTNVIEYGAEAGGTGTLRALRFLGESVKFTSNATPNANDGAALGTTALGWSDIHFATGAVQNYANGNYTITHSSGLLVFSGAIGRGAGAGEYTFDWRPTGGTAGKTAIFQDATASTGSTLVLIKEGAGQSGNDFAIQSSGGTQRIAFHSDGYLTIALPFSTSGLYIGSLFRLTSGNSLEVSQAGAIRWSADNDATTTKDVSLSRIAAGRLGAGSGAQGSVAGDFQARQFFASGDNAGLASTTSLTNVTSATVTNAYVVAGGQAATTQNTGWTKIYVGTTVAWIPYWANATP